jgi:hypothetical protein
VSRQVRTRAMLVRTSQRVRGGGSFPALADPSRRPCNWPSIPSPQYRPFAWLDAEDNAKHWNVWFARSPLLQPKTWQVAGYGSTAVWLHRHPYIGALQTSVSIECQFSRIFPAHPRSLASVLIPRPAARRCSASAVPPFGSGFPNKKSPFSCGPSGEIFSSEPPRKHILALGSGAHSRRFAQECPEGNPGKYNQGELTWHST